MKTAQAFTLTTHSDPLAPDSVISYHRTLSSVLSRAVKWGYIQINPADAAEKPSLGGREAAYLEEGDAWEDQDRRVFTTDTGAPLFPDSVTQWFSGFITRSGMPKVTVHSLRHTHATVLLANNIDAVAVASRLGHADATTTLRTYAHALRRRDDDAARTIQFLLDRADDDLNDEDK